MKFKYFVRNFFYSERNSMKKRSLTIFNYRSILMPHESGLTQHENILNLREQEEYHMKLDDFPRKKMPFNEGNSTRIMIERK